MSPLDLVVFAISPNWGLVWLAVAALAAIVLVIVLLEGHRP